MKKYSYTPSEPPKSPDQIKGFFDDYSRNEEVANISFGRITRTLQKHFDYSSDFQQIVYLRVSPADFQQLLYDEACMRRYKGHNSHEFNLNILNFRSGPLVLTILDSVKQVDGSYTIISEPNTVANELRKKFND